jgi:hypothetical protein
MPYEWFGIEAVDVLFFRDGRAFEAGEEHIAQSQFPPNARTVLGALRGVSFRQVCENLRQYIANGPESDWLTELNTRIGRPDTLGPASILGPFIAEWNEGDGTDSELYFAPPADLVTYVTGITDHDGTARMQYARLSPLSDIPRGVAGTSCGLTPLWLRICRPRATGVPCAVSRASSPRIAVLATRSKANRPEPATSTRPTSHGR